MRTMITAAALAVAVFASPAVVSAADGPAPVPASVLMSRQIDFTSAVNGQRYRIQIAQPFAPPPPGGFPVIYVLDGDAYFGSFAAAARLRSALGAEIAPAVVVGIGYDGDNLPGLFRNRSRDLTPAPADPVQIAQDKAMSGGEMAYAGADDFLRVIETEIKPRVAATLPVNTRREILFGHSLGGLFALHVLFKQPDAFDTYLALSPSIWWGGRALLAEEKAPAARTGEGTPRVFIGVGGLEQSLPRRLPPSMSVDQAKAVIARTTMVDSAVQLATRLQASPTGGRNIRQQVFEGQSHNSVPWAAINPMLDFALGDDDAAR